MSTHCADIRAQGLETRAALREACEAADASIERMKAEDKQRAALREGAREHAAFQASAISGQFDAVCARLDAVEARLLALEALEKARILRWRDYLPETGT